MIHCRHRAETNPLIVRVRLAIQKIEDRVTLIRFFVIAGRQVDAKLLRRLGRVKAALLEVTGVCKTGKRCNCGSWDRGRNKRWCRSRD